MRKDDAMDQDHSLIPLGLYTNVRVHHDATRNGRGSRQKLWLLRGRVHDGPACRTGSSIENSKSGQVLVRTLRGEKGRPGAVPDQGLANFARLCLDHLEHQNSASFHRKFKKRTGFGSHPEGRKRQARCGSGPGASQLCASLPRSSRATELRIFPSKIQKADRFWFAPIRINRIYLTILQRGYVRSSEITRFSRFSCRTLLSSWRLLKE